MSEIAGELTPSGHVLPVRVYYEDTDFTGVVYHARYFQFFERGRSDFLRLQGIDHKALEAGCLGEPYFFAVKSMTIDFHKPASVDDVLMVKTGFSEQKGAILKLPQEIWRGDVKIASLDVTIVLIDKKGAPKRPPKRLLDALLKD